MKNQVQAGDAIYVAAPAGGVISGNAYQIGAAPPVGALFGVAGATAAVGVTFALWVVGCFTLPKLSTDVWAVGDVLYWDNTNFWLTKLATSNLKVAIAIATAASTTTTGTCRLTPG
jgi:predicted RecA/RadA family phage recombinase